MKNILVVYEAEPQWSTGHVKNYPPQCYMKHPKKLKKHIIHIITLKNLLFILNVHINTMYLDESEYRKWGTNISRY